MCQDIRMVCWLTRTIKHGKKVTLLDTTFHRVWILLLFYLKYTIKQDNILFLDIWLGCSFYSFSFWLIWFWLTGVRRLQVCDFWGVFAWMVLYLSWWTNVWSLLQKTWLENVRSSSMHLWRWFSKSVDPQGFGGVPNSIIWNQMDTYGSLTQRVYTFGSSQTVMGVCGPNAYRAKVWEALIWHPSKWLNFLWGGRWKETVTAVTKVS